VNIQERGCTEAGSIAFIKGCDAARAMTLVDGDPTSGQGDDVVRGEARARADDEHRAVRRFRSSATASSSAAAGGLI
jgi:hypothetical protein